MSNSAASQAQRRRDRIARGGCGRCNAPAAFGTALCQRHLDSQWYLRMMPGRWVSSPSSKIPDNVWLGTTAEDQRRYEERVVDHLRNIACRVRFVSLEPQLEDVRVGHGDADWFIVGGESGPGCRPFDPAWAQRTIAAGREFGEPVFVKQLGENWARISGAKQRHGADPREWPAELRVQEFPFGQRLA